MHSAINEILDEKSIHPKAKTEYGMKFFHLSDLHFGKQLHGYELIMEQRHVIRQLAEAVRKERPDAIVVAGDIYDRAVPSAAAMGLLDELFGELEALSEPDRPVRLLVIAGNHDSAGRLRYGSAFLKRHHIHVAVLPPCEDGEKMEKVTLADEYGEVDFYLLPFVKPGMLRHREGAEGIKTSEEAVRYLFAQEDIDWNRRNVLVSHQFYVNGDKRPVRCDSEAPGLFVGGLDEVSTELVAGFDYVALGHIHSPQDVKEHIRYSGTPYPYSISEAGQDKSLTVVEIREKEDLRLWTIPFLPLHEVRVLRGSVKEIAEVCGGGMCHDYVSIILTDEEVMEQPKEYLERYYDHILELQIDNSRVRQELGEEIPDIQALTPFDAFQAFFANTAGRGMTEEELAKFKEILREVEQAG